MRFQSANVRSVVWLNGRKIGGNVGGYFPFEADLKGLRRGRNTLVVKVSSLRSSTDLTHWRPAAVNGYGSGGWWNFGGLLREVYVRRIESLDVESAQVLPRVRRVGCAGRRGGARARAQHDGQEPQGRPGAGRSRAWLQPARGAGARGGRPQRPP